MTDETQAAENPDAAEGQSEESQNLTTETETAAQNVPDAADRDPQDGDAAAEGGEDEKNDSETPDIYVPEGAPEHLLGKSNQETIDNVLKAYKGARDELAKKYNIPESLDDYQIEFTEEEREKFLSADEDGNDPFFDALRESAFKNGIPAEKAANWARDLFEKVHAEVDEKVEGVTNSTVDAKFEKLGGPDKAAPVKKANEAWIQGLQNQGIITEDDASEMLMHTTYGEGLAWLDKIRTGIGGEKSIPADLSGDKGGGDAVTEEKLNEMMKDPKYWKTKDPDYIKKVEEGFKKLYGTEKVA